MVGISCLACRSSGISVCSFWISTVDLLCEDAKVVPGSGALLSSFGFTLLRFPWRIMVPVTQQDALSVLLIPKQPQEPEHLGRCPPSCHVQQS